MSWQDIVVNRILSDEEIKAGLCHIFKISYSEIMITEEVPEEPLSPNIKVLCEKSETEGDFTTLLSVYVRDEKLEDSDVLYSVGQFCEKLGCLCLITDNSVNPYLWILVDDTKKFEKVYLDTDKLDDGLYVIDLSTVQKADSGSEMTGIRNAIEGDWVAGESYCGTHHPAGVSPDPL